MRRMMASLMRTYIPAFLVTVPMLVAMLSLKPVVKANDLDGDSDHYSTSELAHYRAIEASKEIL